MSYKIEISDLFEKQSKKLKKKYPSLSQELQDLLALLISNPFAGTPLGNNIFKVRLAVKSKGKGKSGGLRVITYILVSNKIVFLLFIYDKSEISSIKTELIKKYVLRILDEMKEFPDQRKIN